MESSHPLLNDYLITIEYPRKEHLLACSYAFVDNRPTMVPLYSTAMHED